MKLHKLLWICLGLFALVIVMTGILPFCFPKSVSKEFADSVSVPDFYGDAPCTDRVALVESPADGFLTRIHILDEALGRIDVSYYAIHMSDSTDLFLGALLDAYQANALQVGPDGSYLPDQSVPEVPVPFLKKLMLRALTPIVWLLKGLT